MKVIKKSEGVAYEAAKHFNCWSFRKLAADAETERLTIGVSHFLPNGGVEMSGGPPEKAYYIISGKMIITTKDGEQTLEAGDIAYFPPDEERAIRIPGDEVCTILVCIIKP